MSLCKMREILRIQGAVLRRIERKDRLSAANLYTREGCVMVWAGLY